MKVLLPALVMALLMSVAAQGETRVVALPGKSPLVTFRIVFQTGSASDPAAKPGVANLTAAMLADGGTRQMTKKQLLDALYPMAAGVSSQVDKEMTAFSASTHVDNLEHFYQLFRAMLLDPGWRQEDFDRLRDDAVNYLRVSLRGTNDEELGKEVLYNVIYDGHSYGHNNTGTVSSLEKLTTADLKRFYSQHFTQANLIVGIAGGYPASFVARIKKDFEKLPAVGVPEPKITAPKSITGNHMVMIEKPARSVAYSIGYPIGVKRGDPDFPALLLAQSYLGQHRNSGGFLYENMRQVRGLNYGDYAYIEYFPRGMFLFEPDPNLARKQQIFQLWIRPVEPPTALFTLRLALFDLDKFVKEGLSPEAFERSRSFITKYVNLLTSTKSAELGYAIDSLYYGIGNYNAYLKTSFAKLTRDDVNRAIRKHLRSDNLDIVVVANNCEDLKSKILSGDPSPMTYNSPKPDNVLAEDKIVEKLKIDLKPENIKIIPVEKVFE